MARMYTLPNLRAALKSQGIYLQDFYNAAYKVANKRHVGNRTWAHAMNEKKGVTETTINRMKDIAARALGEFDGVFPDDALDVVPVDPR